MAENSTVVASVEGQGQKPAQPREAVTYRVRPVALRRDRIVVSLSNGIPFIGLCIAVFQIATRRVSGLDLALFFTMYAVSMAGMEVGFHRLFSHRAFESNLAVRAFLAIAGCTCGQGPTASWVANHRMHHSHADAAGDTHSPHVHGERQWSFWRGLWHAQVGWLYRPERAVLGHYARDLLADALVRRIDRHYFLWLAASVVLPAAVGGAITVDWRGVVSGVVWGGLARICLIQHFTYAINSISHRFGSRPFRSNDRSTNNVWLAIPTFGIGWHNNHHAFPFTAKNCFHWWQIDISWGLLVVMRRLGWVWNLKVPTPAMLAAKLVGATPSTPTSAFSDSSAS